MGCNMLQLPLAFNLLMLRFGVGELVGHLKPLGGHTPPTVFTPEVHKVPQPLEFFEEFVKPRVPVVFRGAARRSAATSRWDPGTLASEYGDLVVKVEAKSEASEKIPVANLGLGRCTLRHFATHYQSRDMYVISQMPRAMEKDVAVPPCLRCGNFARSIQNIDLFIVGPGGKTLLHRDPFSNIHCVFNGTKDWILIEDHHEEHLYQSDSSVDEFGGYSDVDVDSVDLGKFPNIQKIDYSLMTVQAGDCIFIPGGYWHQVRVKGQYNTAVSIWFTRNLKSSKQDWSNCEEGGYDFTPLSQVDVLWRFDGGNTSMTQGHVDIHLLRSVLISSANAEGNLSLGRFCQELIRHGSDDHCHLVVEKIKTALKLEDDTMSVNDIKAITIEQLKIIVEFIVPADVANTSGYEYSVIESNDVKELFLDLSAKGGIPEEEFVREYMEELGGSRAVAREVFGKMDQSGRGIVTTVDVENNLDFVVAKFADAPRHDPTTERLWKRYLRGRDEL